MHIIGLDIGTSTISAVVVEGGTPVAVRTQKNDSFCQAEHAWEKVQDAAVIREAALGTVAELLALYPDVAAIGVTGQMHGIVYLDADGCPVSPLYTWQDGRGDLPFGNGRSYAEQLSALTGYPAATGYGLVTHFYHLHNHSVPQAAATFCTVHDYLAMCLADLRHPLTDVSDAASLGVFDVARGCFAVTALARAGIDPAMLPRLAVSSRIGFHQGHIPVFVAIGDNQAAFLFSARRAERRTLCLSTSAPAASFRSTLPLT